MTPDTLASRRAERDRLATLVLTARALVGNGVFARRRLKAGMVVGEIHGEICDEHPADPSYCMELPSGRVLEPGTPFRFLNHSCDPNCELFYWTEEGRPAAEDRLWLQTIRSIEPGEELLIDYAWPADAAIPCQCGAAGCRGWVVDVDELHLVKGAEACTEETRQAPPPAGASG